MARRFLLVLLILSGIAAAASVFWRYNTFVYRRALLEAPEPVRRAIRRAAEIPLKYRIELVKLFPFSQRDSLREWEEKVFKGKVVYAIEQEKDLSYVRALSEGKASALYYKIRLDARTKHPVIAWKWKVNTFPAKKRPESLETQDENDFAARVYVIFPVGFVTNWKVVEYIWAQTLPEGLAGTSPYSKNIRQIVIRSGPGAGDGWHQEERNVVADYASLFGGPPGHDIGAVAFMTNAEHTGTTADALYDEIRIGYAEDGQQEGEGR